MMKLTNSKFTNLAFLPNGRQVYNTGRVIRLRFGSIDVEFTFKGKPTLLPTDRNKWLGHIRKHPNTKAHE